MAATRRLARGDLREAFDTVNQALYDTVVEQWFSAESQATLRALSARLRKG